MFIKKKTKEFLISFIILLFILPLFPRYAMVYTKNATTPNPPAKRPIKVIDASTESPIGGALVTSGNEVARADEHGLCYIEIEQNKVAVRAPGYLRAEQMIPAPQQIHSSPFSPKAIIQALQAKVAGIVEQIVLTPEEVKLVPFTPKGLYLSFYGIGDRTLRESALQLMQETELNALVIDVKGDRGMIPYKSGIPLASQVGAQRIITVKDMGGLIESLREKGIYTIARIVVFKDNLLALKRPDLAVKIQNGEIWRDREDLAWVDPFKKEVWDYNIQVAIEAAQYGFDEIQFDYVRFPDALPPQFSMPNTMENRVRAISGFVMEARERLLPYNVFLSADIFGYVCWNLNDTHIGQTLEDLAPHLDYLSPMLYPSGFQYGIPGYRIPVANPYEIVHLSLKRAQERTQLPAIRFRPWLQAFRDYAFDRRFFEEREIRHQIDGVEKFGSHGWMLWNPRNIYSTEGLKREGSSEFAYQKPERAIREAKVSKRTKEDKPKTDLGQEEIALSDPPQRSSESVTNLELMTVEMENPTDESSPSTESESDQQEGQVVTEDIE